jgi:molybdopterin synthase sulfur carrier subunit
MKVNVILFGQLTDVTGTNNLILQETNDTNALVAVLQEKFPLLQHSKYVIAVDKKLVAENTQLSDNCTVALLPPFSGG